MSAPASTVAAASERRSRVRELDFRRPSKFTRDQLRQLQRAHETFCRSISSRLSAELRDEFALALQGSEQLPYSVAMVEESPRDALVAVLDVHPLGTQVALMLDMPLAHAFVNRLLGGEQPPSDVPETMTDLELSVVACALASIVETLSVSWTEMAGLQLAIAQLETSPAAVELVRPSEPTLLLNHSARMGSLSSVFTVVVPHPSLAPVLPSLDRAAFGADGSDPTTPQTMRRAVSGVDVVLRAEVGAVSMPIADVLALEPGHVIRLGRPAASGTVLCVDEVEVCSAAPGRNGTARAVQVTSPVEPSL